MTALVTLFALAAGFAVLCIVAVAGIALLKVTFKLIFLPLKILLLPLLLVGVLVKVILIFAFGVTLSPCSSPRPSSARSSWGHFSFSPRCGRLLAQGMY